MNREISKPFCVFLLIAMIVIVMSGFISSL
jgi:hypothetical protein